MSGVFGNPWLYNSDDSFYPETIDQSLRFEDGDSAHLYRTTSGTPSSTTSTVFSCWVKRSKLGAIQMIWTAATTAPNVCGYVYFNASDQIQVYLDKSAAGSDELNTTTTAVFRDPSAWMNVVVVYNTADSTTANKSKIYVNGVQQAVSTSVTGSAVTTHRLLDNGVVNTIGKSFNSSSYFDGYLAEFHVVDGVSGIDYDDFGETKDGVWVAKQYSGGHGNNGFYLTFQGTGTATTSNGTTAQTNIGDDQSGNGNNFAVSGLVASDVVLDSPTNSFCTLNPLTHGTYPTLSEGNLKIASVYSSDLSGVASTWYPTTGKWYWEVHNEGATAVYPYLGITDQRQTSRFATNGSYYSVAFLRNGNVASMTGANTYMGTITTNTVTSWTNNDIIMFALDVDARKLWIGKNGTWDGSGDPAAGTGEDASWTVDTGVSPSFMGYASQGLNSVFNFGQDGTFADNQTAQGNADENGVGDFYYSPPSSFLAMATANIENGAIGPQGHTLSDEHFEVMLWQANVVNPTAGDKQISLNFQPDWVWSKNRDNAEHHYHMDSVRGDNSGSKWLINGSSTHAVKGEGADATGNSTASYDFTSTGFDIIDTNSASGEVYYNNGSASTPRKYVGWCWKAGGATPSKTYKVRVDNDGGQNKYRFRNSADDATFATYAPTIDLQEGGTYVFDWSHSTAQAHNIRFSTTSDGTWGGGSEYTIGVVKDDSAYTTTITVASGAPALYYYCQNHSGMGGTVNTNATFGSSNFDGTIATVASTNSVAGFSLFKYSGNNTSGATIGHNLGVTPDHVMIKRFSSNEAWVNWHTGFTSTQYVRFYTTGAVDTATTLFNSTLPSSSVITLGNGGFVNTSSEDYICWAFKAVEGFSAIGTYSGNSNNNGVFVYLGFRPSFVMCRRYSSSGGWHVFDDKRTLEDDESARFNEIDIRIEANDYSAENTSGPPHMDFLSNGFKIRTSFDNINAGTCLYIAYARQPFKFSNAR